MSMLGAQEQAALRRVAVRLPAQRVTAGGRYYRGVAWLKTVSWAQATGALAEAYTAMGNRPMLPVYRPSHGDAPGIIRAHSLDPELLRRTFSVSGALATTPLPWADRELLASVTSRTNQCFY